MHSFINLAAVQIRRELIDLARRYDGPEGLGRHHVGQGRPEGSGPAGPPDPGRPTPTTRPGWRPGPSSTTQIEALPDDEKEIFDLLWYQGLTQAEAAVLLGVTERVVRYRWRSARLKLHELARRPIPD